ncbi:MAG: hypothetical protein IAE83_11750 [Anaerolinea sp.]|nr:hypothetical protein [Anaerolinea sp.]
MDERTVAGWLERAGKHGERLHYFGLPLLTKALMQPLFHLPCTLQPLGYHPHIYTKPLFVGVPRRLIVLDYLRRYNEFIEPERGFWNKWHLIASR